MEWTAPSIAYLDGTTREHLKGPTRGNARLLMYYAVILHGRSVNIFITDENQTTGANWAMEIWTRAVEKEWNKAQRNGQAFPAHCILFGDNTSRELRNSCVSKVFSAMTAASVFTSCSLKHLPVGHTHEDVGQKPGGILLGVPSLKSSVCKSVTSSLKLCVLTSSWRLRCFLWLVDHDDQ